MDYKLELVLIPVTDVDRAKKFYLEQAGFVLIVDTPVGEGWGMRTSRILPSSMTVRMAKELRDWPTMLRSSG